MEVKPWIYNAAKIVFFTLTVIALLLVARVTTVTVATPFVIKEASKGNFGPANSYFTMLYVTGDFMEPYKAPYNIGTTYLHADQYDLAENFLSDALVKVDYLYSECYIRNNLAITLEKQGDYYKESEVLELANSYYEQAIEVITNAPSMCFPPPPQGQNGEGDPTESPSGGNPNPGDSPAKPENLGENGEQMKETEGSSQNKSNEIKDNQGSSGEDQVQEEMDQSREEQQNQSDQQNQESNTGKPPVDKPW